MSLPFSGGGASSSSDANQIKLSTLPLGNGSISKGAFRSYYNASAASNDVKPSGEKNKLNELLLSVLELNVREPREEAHDEPEFKFLPHLLPGEEIVARAQGVYLFQPLSRDNQGLIGELYVTNFKLSFQTIRFPDYQLEHRNAIQDYWHPWMVGLIDIPLASISGLYRLSKNGRRKPFKIGPLKRLLVVCRNFRMEKFSFQQSSLKDTFSMASALAGYVSPIPVDKERLFVYSGAPHLKKDKATVDQVGIDKTVDLHDRAMDFSTRSDWLHVLSQTAVVDSSTWRITQANEQYHLCHSLPKCFVIPASIGEDRKLEELCRQLPVADEGRPLVWSWSYTNGAALCRMSSDLASDAFAMAVKESHPLKKAPVICDIGMLCPTIRDIRKQYDALKDILLVDSASALESSDDKWFSDLENTRWISSISKCLEVCRLVVDNLMQRVSVVLKETGDRDLNCVIASLVQLCMDPECRKQIGFQLLVEKEFVAMGHRFQDRLGLVKDSDKESPVFLLFLDCVFQLTQQYPSSFEFNDAYLVLLWDTALLGCFKNFSMNCQRDHYSANNPSATNPQSVWQINLTETDSKSRERLLNPLYRASTELKNLAFSLPNLLSSAAWKASWREYPLDIHVIIPTSFLSCIKIWTHCYFRFIYPLVWSDASGGQAKMRAARQEYRVLRALCKEVLPLMDRDAESDGEQYDTMPTERSSSIQRFVDGALVHFNPNSSPRRRARDLAREDLVDGDTASLSSFGGKDRRMHDNEDRSSSPPVSASVSRRRSQLLRPFGIGSGSAASSTSAGYTHSLMTFQK